jgi:DUF4097 and DUF4098 domain-containing protein YvlB
MKLQILAATALLAVSTAAIADGHFDRTLSVGSASDLYVATGSGNIQIHAGTGNQIHVSAHVHAGWAAFGDVDARIKRISDNPPITQSGNAVHIGEVNDHDLFNNISIDYDISVPTDVALNLHSGSGDLRVSQVGRYLNAATGSGNIVSSGIHGAAEVQSGSGDISLEQGGSGDVKARTGSGNIHIHGLNGSLQARSGSGDITADGRLTGPATLSSGSGNVTLHLGSEAHFNIEASTGSGDIHVNYPNAPQTSEHSRHHLTGPVNGGGAPLEIRTGSGNIDIAS